MRISVEKLASSLQTLFTTGAAQAAQESTMIRRQRKISGAHFVQTLDFGWLENPKATVDELAEQLGVSKQGSDQRWTLAPPIASGRSCDRASRHLFAASPKHLPVAAVQSVLIDDCTSWACRRHWPGSFPAAEAPTPRRARPA